MSRQPYIPISQVALGADEEELVVAVLRSGHLAQGSMVAKLEAEVAGITGAVHAIAVSSGTAALTCAIRALQLLGHLAADDEVITSSFTFVATLNAALNAGLSVRLADIDAEYCIDPASVAELITPKTRLLMPVHLYGLPCDMAAILDLVDRHHLLLIEDSAQALGARFHGQATGSFGLGCFSFYATKNITAGEGGAITTNDDELARVLRLLRNQGMAGRYDYETSGYNFRMTDLQAAIAVAQLRRFKEIQDTRQDNARRLTAELAGCPGLVLPLEPPGRRSAWHQYTIRVTDDARVTRDELAAHLGDQGIGSGVYYPRTVDDYPCFAHLPQLSRGPLPRAELSARQVLSLPIHPHLPLGGIERIATAVRTALVA